MQKAVITVNNVILLYEQILFVILFNFTVIKFLNLVVLSPNKYYDFMFLFILWFFIIFLYEFTCFIVNNLVFIKVGFRYFITI